MRRLSDIVTFFIFLLAIASNCQQAAEITSAKSLTQTTVVNAIEFSNVVGDFQLLTPDDDADEILNLPLAQSGISVDDLLALLPLTVSKAVLHPAHPKPPEILRL
jgi:hypothetical protein